MSLARSRNARIGGPASRQRGVKTPPSASAGSRDCDPISLPVAKTTCGGDNLCMPKGLQQKSIGSGEPASAAAPFSAGSMVVVTLGNPRDKFWGMILGLGAEGLSLSGIELASFEDLVLMVKDGEAFSPAVVFFPMHRIERIELDLPDGNLPSLSQRFSAKTGLDPALVLSSQGMSQTVDRRASPARSSSASGKDSA
jgi:hypothetical protein